MTCSVSLTQKFHSLSGSLFSQIYSSLHPNGPLETERARPERLSSEHWSAVAGLLETRLKNPWKKTRKNACSIRLNFKYNIYNDMYVIKGSLGEKLPSYEVLKMQ